jgi:ABC-type sugar transport system permease subunit
LIIFIAGLQGIPRELEEAAYVDGATPTQSFFRVVLPLLRPIVGIVVTMILIDAFRLFETVLIMTQGGPGYWSTDVLGYYIYREAFSNLNLSYGATIAVALLVAVAALSVVSFRFTTKRVD